MGTPNIPSQRGSVASLSPSDAAASEKPNQRTRHGFNIATSLHKRIKGFFRPQEAQATAPTAPAAFSAKQLSVEIPMKAFPENCRQECLQHLQKAKEKRSALPHAEKFAGLAEDFTRKYDAFFSRAFQEPLPGTPVQEEIDKAEMRALNAIWSELNEDRLEGKDCAELAIYMRRICANGTLTPQDTWFIEMPELQGLETKKAETRPELPKSPPPTLSKSEEQALRATFEGILPDWTPPAATASPAIQAKPEKNIIERIYRTHVGARKMLIPPTPGTTAESRKSFDAFSARLDKIYLASFEEQFEDLRSKNHSVSEAAAMAAETAFNVAALTMRLETIRTGDQAGLQYVKDMFGKEDEIKQLAVKLLDGPGKLLRGEVKNARSEAERTLIGEPHDRAEQDKPNKEKKLGQPASLLRKQPGKLKSALARITARKKTADKNAQPILDSLKDAGKRTRIIFDRAREICVVGVQAPESFDDIFKNAFKARFEEGVKVLKDAKMTAEQVKQLPKTWRHDIAYVAALEATVNLIATMKASIDPNHRAYANELWRVRRNFEATIQDLFYATRLLSVKEAGNVLSKKEA